MTRFLDGDDKRERAGARVSRRMFLSGVAVGAVGSAMGREAAAQGFQDFVFDLGGGDAIPAASDTMEPVESGGDGASDMGSGADPDTGSDMDAGPMPDPVSVRRNVYALDPNGATMAALRQGVSEMMTRPVTDPTSWMFQANIHGFTGGIPAGLPQAMRDAWMTCEHANRFFLSWHRMYLHFFERILRDASGDPGFALPYWDYSVPGQAALPPAFRDAASPLFRAERDTFRIDVNGGQPLPPQTTESFSALQNVTFAPFGFAGAVESVPHNVVHVAVGGRFGLMTDPRTAAQDPIFWLHHCNIDRLWNRWLSLGGGRANPTNDFDFMNRRYVFFDETGARREMSGSEVLDSAEQLGYRYDDEPPPPRGFSPEPFIVADAGGAMESGVAPLAAAGGSVSLREGATDVSLAPAFEAGGPGAFATATDGSGPARPVILQLDGVDFDAPPGVWYEIYVNLPEGAAPDPRGPYYAGLLALFAQNQSEDPVGYDITGLLNRQIERGLYQGGPVAVRFVAPDDGGAAESGAAPVEVRIGGVRILRQ